MIRPLISGILILSAVSLVFSADRVIQFNRNVRPILADRRPDREASAQAERGGKRAMRTRIAQWARWESWSLIPLLDLPVKNTAWPLNPIGAFVLERETK